MILIKIFFHIFFEIKYYFFLLIIVFNKDFFKKKFFYYQAIFPFKEFILSKSQAIKKDTIIFKKFIIINYALFDAKPP